MAGTCGQCGREFKSIGNHWSMSSECEHPSFTQHQRDIITGLLMGDGWINSGGRGNPYIESKMISPDYLKYVDRQMGIFGNGISMVTTAEESARNNRESGFRPNAKAENYSDLYQWSSMCHPELEEFSSWYSTGEKVWPDNIELTPIVLKHWYCGDGHWGNSGSQNNIQIGMSNEAENTDKVDKYFERVGIPCPSNYNISEISGVEHCVAQFTVEGSHELWEYMGGPLPDFEYKWPEQYRKN